MKAKLSLSLLCLLCSRALADETSIKLKADASSEVVEANCSSCHSLDYILMNSPYPSGRTWDAIVTKMIKVFGAPIDDKDVQAIKAYLAKNYGTEATSAK